MDFEFFIFDARILTLLSHAPPFTSSRSFEEITSFKDKILRAKDMDKVPVVLVGNKCDLDDSERQVEIAAGEDLAENLGCPFFETSAKSKINNEECFYECVREIIKLDEEETASKSLKKKKVRLRCNIL